MDLSSIVNIGLLAKGTRDRVRALLQCEIMQKSHVFDDFCEYYVVLNNLIHIIEEILLKIDLKTQKNYENVEDLKEIYYKIRLCSEIEENLSNFFSLEIH